MTDTIKLWHDDVRPAPDGWVHARTNAEAIRILLNERVEEASFDHDLGYSGPLPERCDCGRDPNCPICDGDGFIGGDLMYVAGTSADDGTKLAEWLARHPALIPPKVTIHSWNFAGAERMASILNEAGAVVTIAPFKLGRTI